jgi:Raf kinase inhibitor-like YbhB/YbcL family protein
MASTRLQGKSLMSFFLIVLGTGVLVAIVSVVLPLLARSQGVDAAPLSTSHPFTLTSPDFKDGGALPQSSEFNQFGCTGANIAPQLDWTGVPKGTKGFALTVTDYDAPVARGFHHWIVYNIPASARELEGNNPFSEGTNSYGTVGYGGPCPPPDGQLHHYVFRLYALSISHVSGKALTFDALLNAIDSSVIGTTSRIGTFKLTS